MGRTVPEFIATVAIDLVNTMSEAISTSKLAVFCIFEHPLGTLALADAGEFLETASLCLFYVQL